MYIIITSSSNKCYGLFETYYKAYLATMATPLHRDEHFSIHEYNHEIHDKSEILSARFALNIPPHIKI